MLCQICSRSLQGIWDPAQTKRLGPSPETLDAKHALEPEKYIFAHHIDGSSWELSVKQGCTLCSRLDSWRENLDRNSLLASSGCHSAFTVSLAPHDGSLTDRSRSSMPSVTFYLDHGKFTFELEAYQGPGTGKYHDQAVMASVEAALVVIESWFKPCVENHECGPSDITASTRTPEFLLEFGATENHSKALRLIKSSSSQQEAPYMTLSHGSGTLVSSVPLTPNSWYSVDILPEAIQDATRIMDRLGLTYLWVETLCTDQTAARHDQASSEKYQQDLAQIFRSGIIHIASINDQEHQLGVFSPRDSTKLSPFEICPDSSGKPKPYIFRFENEEDWPLQTRGEQLVKDVSTLFGRLIAPRSLLLVNNQVFWECGEATASEVHPELAASSAAKEEKHSFNHLIDMDYEVADSETKRQFLLDWYRIAEYCSKCYASEPAEIHAKALGIALTVQLKMADAGVSMGRYLAGHWERSIPESLLWNLRSPGQRLGSLGAPSWSWASVNGPLNIQASYTDMSTWLTKLIEVGEAPEHTLSLHGSIAIAEISPPSRQKEAPRGTRMLELLRDFDQVAHPTNKVQPVGKHNQRPEEVNVLQATVTFDTAADVCQHVACIAVRVQQSAGSMWALTALALEQQGSDALVFRRIGIVTLLAKNEKAAMELFKDRRFLDVKLQ